MQWQEQEGSRFLQWKLAGNCSEEEKTKIYDLAMPETAGPLLQTHPLCLPRGQVGKAAEVKLATDAFGNFVVQKLVEHGAAEQLEATSFNLILGCWEFQFQSQ